MTQIKKAPVANNGQFQAIANVNFSLPVNIYEGVKRYNERYISEVREVNGSNARMPDHLTLRNVARGDILLFGDTAIVNEDTGNVEVYPMQVYKELNARTIELPCEMRGNATANFEKSLEGLPAHMRKVLEASRDKVTARFRIVPIMEEYIGQELND